MSHSKIPSQVLAQLLLCSALALPLLAQDSVPVRNRPLVAIIDSFLRHPVPGPLAQAVTESAAVRSDVMVNMSINFLPFLKCDQDSDPFVKVIHGMLVIGFVAGNMREQLRLGRNGDQPAAGLKGELTVYDVLRAQGGTYRSPELDAWPDTSAATRLQAVADSLAAMNGDPCAHHAGG